MTTMTSRNLKRIAVVLLLCLPLLSGLRTEARAGGTPRYRERMLQLVNDVRDRKDRRLLRVDRKLSRYATKHSQQMADLGYLFHTNDLASKLDGRNWSIGGENVGFASSLRAVMGNFMDSAGHRRNILGRGFDHAAVGVVKSNGSLWVTTIFYG
ncbi:MAG: CAP domain-containing protein [Actinomycetota bacterium]